MLAELEASARIRPADARAAVWLKTGVSPLFGIARAELDCTT